MASFNALSTRSISTLLVEKARERGVRITVHDFISTRVAITSETIQQLETLIKNKKTTLVFTSKHAVENLQHPEIDKSIFEKAKGELFCLSGKTRQAVNTAPFLLNFIVKGEGEHATALAREIIKQKAEEVVFICGNKRRDELPDILREAGIMVHEIMLYETVKTPIEIKEDIDALLFFSPTAAESFFSANHLKKAAVCFAIGNTTAASIAALTDNRIIISAAASEEMMIEALLTYADSQPPVAE